MGMSAKAFDLGRESRGDDGRFQRQDSVFRDIVASTTPGRHHLYLSYACPWAHRALIVRHLKGLDDVVGVSFVNPYRDERGWMFTDAEHHDDLHGWTLLSEAYLATDPAFAGRVSVPVLWDREEGRIVNNESGDIVKMLNRWGSGPDLEPAELQDEIDAVNALVYENVNNGVYRAGFASSQEAYEEAFTGLFDALARLDDRLGRQRYLAGDVTTLADWRLFTTLVRFDAVYHTHFKCNGHRLIEYPNLWPYARELYQVPGVAQTVRFDEIKRHYYTTHDMINPTRIIPAGPLDMDWEEPHGRG
ncbi:MAG: glutathione S-transferase family protein [Solirubrobacterales bacterium]|nr:glutathione S-transferase family protein [Solirubrobacterales bacterium]